MEVGIFGSNVWLSVAVCLSIRRSNLGTTNGVSLGRGYLFVLPIEDGRSVQETRSKIIQFGDANEAEFTLFKYSKEDKTNWNSVIRLC